MDVSVVICANDSARWSQLQAALRSVELQDHPPAEVIVVIDHNPALLERARRELDGALVVENSEPPGLGGARNSGIAASSSEVVAFLDDDAVASPEWLSHLVAHYSDPDVVGVGGGVHPVWATTRPRWFPREFDWVVGCSYRGMPETAEEVRNPIGCNMSFRRELLNAIGRFRPGLTLRGPDASRHRGDVPSTYSCDETELCIRLRQRWPWRKLVYVPDGMVFHQVPAERARLRYFLTRCFREGGSKAVISTLVSPRDGLSSERRYTREVLPRGMRLGVADFLRRGDPHGLTRAAAIVAGLAVTSVSYAAGRVRAHASDELLRSAYSLMVNVALTTLLGVVFWLAAARLYDAESVGRDAALIAAMMELSVICQVNLVNGITRFLPALERGTARALLSAYSVTGGAALVVGTAFVLIAPIASHEFAFLGEHWTMAALYVLAQVLWTWFALQDAALTAMRRAQWVPVENGVFGVLKIAALPVVLAIGAAHGVFLASVLPVILLLIPVNVFLFRTAIPDHLRGHRSSGSLLRRLSRRRLVGFMGQDWGASVLSHSSATALPLIVVALLGASANAYFYIPYTIVVAFTMLFYGACTSLVVEGALAEDRIRALAAQIVRLYAAIVVPGTIVLAAAAPLILLPFGPDYASEGAPVLRILAIGGLFRCATLLYVAIARLQGKGARILAVHATEAILVLAGALALAGPLGLEGVALGWLGAMALAQLSVLRSLVRFLHSGEAVVTPSQAPAPPRAEEVALP